MKITKHTPPPVVPAPTYDILGLTEAEMRTIKIGVGRMNKKQCDEEGADYEATFALHDAIDDVLTPQDF